MAFDPGCRENNLRPQYYRGDPVVGLTRSWVTYSRVPRIPSAPLVFERSWESKMDLKMTQWLKTLGSKYLFNLFVTMETGHRGHEEPTGREEPTYILTHAPLTTEQTGLSPTACRPALCVSSAAGYDRGAPGIVRACYNDLKIRGKVTGGLWQMSILMVPSEVGMGGNPPNVSHPGHRPTINLIMNHRVILRRTETLEYFQPSGSKTRLGDNSLNPILDHQDCNAATFPDSHKGVFVWLLEIALRARDHRDPCKLRELGGGARLGPRVEGEEGASVFALLHISRTRGIFSRAGGLRCPWWRYKRTATCVLRTDLGSSFRTEKKTNSAARSSYSPPWCSLVLRAGILGLGLAMDARRTLDGHNNLKQARCRRGFRRATITSLKIDPVRTSAFPVGHRGPARLGAQVNPTSSPSLNPHLSLFIAPSTEVQMRKYQFTKKVDNVPRAIVGIY
ncbi:hypothetical protein B0H11DRAFT_1901731 [Mycena galericulata]|nr:hypothetical protein B0H11DRAFT_1901731 [Mycena galericulata]